MTRTDRDHLNVLSICHYVLGGLCFLFGLFPFIYLAIGILMVAAAPQGKNGPPPEAIGWFFIAFSSFFIALYWAMGLMMIHAGNCLRRQKSRTFCLVTAGVSCLMQPLGTVLGVFTIIVLMRPSVCAAFEPYPEAELADSREESQEEADEHDRYYTD
jgi:hypothetical protein